MAPVALGDSYATLATLRGRVGITDATFTTEDTRLTTALSVASRSIERMCNRQFNDAGSASARLFYPDTYCRIDVDDFNTTTGLIVATDEDNDGVFETTWTLNTDFQLEPLNGVVDGESGWPYYTIRAIGTRRFPCTWYPRRASVQVTARWGWTAVPAPIAEATLVLAEETYMLKDTPFGSGGFGQYGIVRARPNPFAMTKIGPYINQPVLVA